MDGTVRWFLKPEAKASAHIVIARDGSVVQMVPLDRVAWHAGVSRWGELNGLNAWSIGIELVNAGKLKRHGDRWVSWAGTTIPNSEVQIARHSLDSEATGWHAYTEKQIEVCFEVARALHAQFSFQDLLGHDDVAPERKRDPGPAFPLEAFRARLFGRA